MARDRRRDPSRARARWAIAGVAVVAALCLPARGSAQATLRVESTTECPGRDAVVGSLPTGIEILDGDGAAPVGAMVLSVHRTGRTTSLELGPLEGPSISRTFRSRDCSAIAGAIGEVVRARFVELRLLPDRPPASGEPPPAETDAAPADESVVAGTTPIEEVPELPRADPASPIDAPVPAILVFESAARDTAVPEVSAPEAPAASSTLSIAITGGPTLSLDGLFAGCARIVVALEFDPIVVRVGGAFSGLENRGLTNERVRFIAADVWAGLGLRSAGTLRVDGGADAGAELLVVQASDLPGQPERLRALLIVGVWTALSFDVLEWLAIRAELAASFFPARERYRIEPAGVVAETQLGRLSLAVGLEGRIP